MVGSRQRIRSRGNDIDLRYKLSLSCMSNQKRIAVTTLHCMRDPGIEPGSVPWQGTILPLNQPRFRFHVHCIQS